jgi:hypothetical protein
MLFSSEMGLQRDAHVVFSAVFHPQLSVCTAMSQALETEAVTVVSVEQMHSKILCFNF